MSDTFPFTPNPPMTVKFCVDGSIPEKNELQSKLEKARNLAESALSLEQDPSGAFGAADLGCAYSQALYDILDVLKDC